MYELASSAGRATPVHGTPHEPARGSSNHASDSVLREVLRRRLRVQVRDRADGSKRRGPSGIRASASKVVLPRARRWVFHAARRRRRRALSGSRLTDATVTSFRMLSSVWRPKFRPGSIATRRYRGLRAHPDRFCTPPQGPPSTRTEKSATDPRPFSLLAPRRHVVLPPDIASSCLRVAFSLRYVTAPPDRVETLHARRFPTGVASSRFNDCPHPAHSPATFGCERWFFKAFPPPDSPPPRALHSSSRARSLTIRSPFVHQAEWRGLGVQQSRGWVHYAIHRPEPHIMLYRCVRRPCPHAAVGFASFARGFFKPIGVTRVRRGVLTAPADRIGPAMTSSHPRVPLGDPRLARRAESLAPRPTTRSTLFHIETDNPYRTIDRRTLNYGQPALTDAANQANQQ